MTLSNIHPIIVHFPIVLLCLYPFLIAIAIFWKKQRRLMLVISAFVLLLGGATASWAEETGEMIDGPVKKISAEIYQALERHEGFAELTMGLVAVTFVIHIFTLLFYEERIFEWKKKLMAKLKLGKYNEFFEKKYRFLQKFKQWYLYLLLAPAAIAMLVGISLTGSTGGTLTHHYHVGALACLDSAHPLEAIAESLMPLDEKLDKWQRKYSSNVDMTGKEMFETLCGGLGSE